MYYHVLPCALLSGISGAKKKKKKTHGSNTKYARTITDIYILVKYSQYETLGKKNKKQNECALILAILFKFICSYEDNIFNLLTEYVSYYIHLKNSMLQQLNLMHLNLPGDKFTNEYQFWK